MTRHILAVGAGLLLVAAGCGRSELDLFLDGTAEFAGIEDFPDMDQGVTVLVVGPDATGNVTAELRPNVTFKEGRAVKARLNWGKIEAPTLAKSALWSITAADNTFNLLQTIAVDDINEFLTTKCMEVKEEWQGK